MRSNSRRWSGWMRRSYAPATPTNPTAARPTGSGPRSIASGSSGSGSMRAGRFPRASTTPACGAFAPRRGSSSTGSGRGHFGTHAAAFHTKRSWPQGSRNAAAGGTIVDAARGQALASRSSCHRAFHCRGRMSPGQASFAVRFTQIWWLSPFSSFSCHLFHHHPAQIKRRRATHVAAQARAAPVIAHVEGSGTPMATLSRRTYEPTGSLCEPLL